MLAKNPSTPKFLDKGETCFSEICGTCDIIYRDLRSKGIGVEVCHAPIITPEEEDKLWQSGVLSITNPKALQRCVFFYVGKCFCVRGGQEQRTLGPSNFKFIANPSDDPNCVVYIEHSSKNWSGGLGDLRVENKEVSCHAVRENIPKCLVFLLDLYMKKLHKYAFEKDFLIFAQKHSLQKIQMHPSMKRLQLARTHFL